jgi:tRNA A-37 threonylcarbamoyl transferase component Bud32
MDGWVRIDADGFRWTVRRSAREELARSLLGRGGDPGPALPLPRLRRGRSFHALPSEGGGLFVKRHVAGRYDATLLYRIAARRMRGRREFEAARRAFERGAPTPEPLAFGVAHRWLRSYESRLVYRHLPAPARPLAALALRDLPEPRRAQLVAELARLAASLHARGLFHMDLTPLNSVLLGDADGDYRLVAVDVETLELGSPSDGARARGALRRTLETFGWEGRPEGEAFERAYRAARGQTA